MFPHHIQQNPSKIIKFTIIFNLLNDIGCVFVYITVLKPSSKHANV